MLSDGEKWSSEARDVKDIGETQMLIVDKEINCTNSLDSEGMSTGKEDSLIPGQGGIFDEGSLVREHMLRSTRVQDEHEATVG